jgi:hypothetical protein
MSEKRGNRLLKPDEFCKDILESISRYAMELPTGQRREFVKAVLGMIGSHANRPMRMGSTP